MVRSRCRRSHLREERTGSVGAGRVICTGREGQRVSVGTGGISSPRRGSVLVGEAEALLPFPACRASPATARAVAAIHGPFPANALSSKAALPAGLQQGTGVTAPRSHPAHTLLQGLGPRGERGAEQLRHPQEQQPHSADLLLLPPSPLPLHHLTEPRSEMIALPHPRPSLPASLNPLLAALPLAAALT